MRKKTYRIVMKRAVFKDVRCLPGAILDHIYRRIATLATDPLPHDAEPIQGYKNHYRIRIGQYRVIYEIAAQIRIIVIIRIGHRKDIYQTI